MSGRDAEAPGPSYPREKIVLRSARLKHVAQRIAIRIEVIFAFVSPRGPGRVNDRSAFAVNAHRAKWTAACGRDGLVMASLSASIVAPHEDT